MKLNNQEILLWDGLRAGKEKDLHSLYILYYNDLLRYGLYLSGDLELSKEYINLLFLSFWTNRQKLPEVKNPKAYLITSYKNKIIFRKKKSGDLKMVYTENENVGFGIVASWEETLIELHRISIQKFSIGIPPVEGITSGDLIRYGMHFTILSLSLFLFSSVKEFETLLSITKNRCMQ